MLKIEKILLIEFDEVRERQRLENSFKGRERKELLAILDAFIAGDWTGAMALTTGISRDMQEYLHPVVFDTLREMHATRLSAATYAAMPAAPEFNQSIDFRGLPLGPEGALYPKFQII